MKKETFSLAYFYLLLAIFLEIVAAIFTRYTEGFTLPLPTATTVLSAVSSYFIFSLSLKHGMKISLGYAIWSGLGVLVVALIGVTVLGDSLSLLQIAGILLIIVGLMIVQLKGANQDTSKN